jgi:putative transposase
MIAIPLRVRLSSTVNRSRPQRSAAPRGRERHLPVDTLGLIWGLAVLPADIQDRDGAKTLLQRLRPRLPRLPIVWADGAYVAVVDWAQQTCGWILTTILRPLGVEGYVHLPKRWVVERTFGWLGRYRRLSKDYEANPRSSETWIYLARINHMSRRMLPTHDPDNRWNHRRAGKR